MLLHRIARHVAALILFSSWITALYAQGFPNVPRIEPAGTIEATGTEIQPTPGAIPASLEFGAALALHGHTLAAAMPGFGDHTGRVAIFVRDRSGNWIREASLDPSDGHPGDFGFFGERVAIWGDEALVGSIRGVYVYRRRDSRWQEVQKLPSTAEVPLDEGLALGEHWAFIGSSVAGKPGEVRVYYIARDGGLREVQVLDSRMGMPDDGFGARIAFSHGALLVGAPQDTSGQGAAYVFENYGPHWFERQKLIALGGRPGDSFGASVAIDHNTIAIGAPNAERDPDQDVCQVGYSGAVYVFEPHRGGLWFEQQELLGPPKCAYQFGGELQVDRGFLVTSTPTLYAVYGGATFIYQRQGRQFVPSAIAGNSEVGGAPLALWNSSLFVGAPNDHGFSTGFAWLYDLSELRATQ